MKLPWEDLTQLGAYELINVITCLLQQPCQFPLFLNFKTPESLSSRMFPSSILSFCHHNLQFVSIIRALLIFSIDSQIENSRLVSKSQTQHMQTLQKMPLLQHPLSNCLEKKPLQYATKIRLVLDTESTKVIPCGRSVSKILQVTSINATKSQNIPNTDIDQLAKFLVSVIPCIHSNENVKNHATKVKELIPP